jgi:hypothetical protein
MPRRLVYSTAIVGAVALSAISEVPTVLFPAGDVKG